MPDPEFEKQIQQKMLDLKLGPSDAVWAKVEKEIKEDKKHRRVLLWFFLFFGMLVSGSIYFMINPLKNNTAPNNIISNKQQQAVPGNGNEEKKRSPLISDGTNSSDSNTVKEKPIRLQTPNIVAKSSGNKNYGPVVSTGSSKLKNPLPAYNKKNIAKISTRTDPVKQVDDISPTDQTADQGIKKMPGKTKNLVNNQAAKETTDNSLEKNSNQSKESTAGNNNIQPDINDKIATDDAKKEKNVQPGSSPAINTKKDTAAIGASGNIDKKNKAIAKIVSKKLSPWKTGFTVSPGFGAINNELFSSEKSVADVAALYYPVTAGAAPSPSSPSTIQKGFSFAAGAFLQKQLLKKLSLSVGLNYHYYSTKIQTGKKIDSTLYLNSSVFTLASSYYHAGSGNEHINQYHFLELPVVLDWQINNSKRFPLFLNGGLVLSRLIASNALHYNSSSSIYYKDNSVFQKTQVGGSAGISIGFRIHSAFFQAGPQLQYNFTDLIKNNPSTGEHLFFTGIKLVMIPGKK